MSCKYNSCYNIKFMNIMTANSIVNVDCMDSNIIVNNMNTIMHCVYLGISYKLWWDSYS